jgi:fatty acid desaturase
MTSIVVIMVIMIIIIYSIIVVVMIMIMIIVIIDIIVVVMIMIMVEGLRWSAVEYAQWVARRGKRTVDLVQAPRGGGDMGHQI